MPPAETVAVVLLTAPDAAIGGGLARTLVEERLAACVNVVPGVRSIYRWEGRIQEDAEVLLIAKTRTDRCEALARRVREIHPYTLPEVLVLPASGGHAPYLDWVAAETQP